MNPHPQRSKMANYRIGELKDEYIPDIEDKRLFGSRLADYILPIKRNDKWTQLRLFDELRQLSPSAWKRLGIILSTNKHVRYLSLYECAVDVAGLFVGLKMNRSIKELCFVNTDLKKEVEINSLAPFLSRLKTIELSCCKIGPLFSKALGVAMGKTNRIKEFAIDRCEMDMTRLCVGLQKNQSIEKLIFQSMDLREASVINSVAIFLSHNPCLKKFELNGCNIGSSFAIALSDALSRSYECDTVPELDISNNNFGQDPFCRSRTLSSLALRSNAIGVRGCTSIANLLNCSKSHLRTLELDHNYIDGNAGMLLVEALTKNDKLETLSIAGNRCTHDKGFWLTMLRLVCNTSSVNGLINSNHTICKLPDSAWLTSLATSMDETLGVDDGNLLRASLKINGKSHKASVARRKILWAVVRGKLDLGDITDVEGMLVVKRCLADGNIIQNDDPFLPQGKIDLARVSLDFIFAFFQKNGGVQHLQS